MDNKEERLKAELLKFETKVKQLTKDWAETKGGSRYGDEYGEIQIKVYNQMIEDVKNELKKISKP